MLGKIEAALNAAQKLPLSYVKQTQSGIWVRKILRSLTIKGERSWIFTINEITNFCSWRVIKNQGSW